MVQKEGSFKDSYYKELRQRLCSADWNHLCKFGRIHHEKQLCEISLNLDVKSYLLSGALGAPLFNRV